MMKSEVYAEPVCPSQAQGKLVTTRLGTKARELLLILTGKLAPALGRDGPIPHQRQGKNDPDGMGIAELALSPLMR